MFYHPFLNKVIVSVLEKSWKKTRKKSPPLKIRIRRTIANYVSDAVRERVNRSNLYMLMPPEVEKKLV